MNKLVITGVAIVVLITLGSYLIYSFGSAQYSSGYNKAREDNSESLISVILTDKVEMDKIKNEIKTMSEIDINNTLRDLGIMRDNTDY